MLIQILFSRRVLPPGQSPTAAHLSCSTHIQKGHSCRWLSRSSSSFPEQPESFSQYPGYCPLILRIGERSFRKVLSKKVFELSMNFPIGMEIFCVLSLLESEKGYFARCFWKKFKKILSRPIQSAFCDWTAHFSIMHHPLAPTAWFLFQNGCRFRRPW